MHVEITNRWNDYLSMFSNQQKDIYYLEEYVKLYSSLENKALSIVCIEGDKVLLMPFLSGKIGRYFDFETPYGYGGPITNSGNQQWIDSALEEMAACFADNGYICGFIRFHPLLRNAEYCKNKINVIYDRQTVFIDTGHEDKDIWNNQITSKNRNMIRKAEKSGLIYQADYMFDTLSEFMRLYNHTMQRINASEFYFFNNDYYKNFTQYLSKYSFLGTVRYKGDVICSAIFMYFDKYGHYHLEGSNNNYSSLGANNFLLWNSALELKKKGIQEFHLGGGYDSKEDNSLFKFKKSFSPNRGQFYIGKCIFNNKMYNSLCKEWEMSNPEKISEFGNMLLKYRY